MSLERYLCEGQFARGQLSHRNPYPHLAYVAMRGNTHGSRELARKMKQAVTGNSSEILKANVLFKVGVNVVQNSAEP